MRAQQEATHLTNLPWTIAGSLLGASLLLTALWNVVAPRFLLSWLGTLVVVLGARLISAAVHRAMAARRAAAGPDAAFTKAWLLRHRIGFFVHGCVWGAAVLLPMPVGDHVHLAVLVVMLMTVAIGSFTVTTFDMAAGLSFGTPVLVILSAHLFMQPDPSLATLGVAALAALGYMTLTARRAHRYVRGYVALRVSEAGQARALREQHHLLNLLVQTTSEGFWFIDAQRLTTDANPAMCRILQRTRDQFIG